MNKRRRNTSKSMRNKKIVKMNMFMNTDLPGKDEGKQIIYHTLKASIYGVRVNEIPFLENKLNSY